MKRAIGVLIAALLIMTITGDGVGAAPETTPFDPVIDLLMHTPQNGWDAVLTKNKPLLGEDFLTQAMLDALKAASAGNLDVARNYAVVADYVDCFIDPKKQYNGNAQLYLGQFLISQKNAAAAIPIAEVLEKTHPDCFAGPLLFGMVYLDQKEKKRAIDELKKAVQMRPTSGEAHYTLGLAYYAAGEKTSARAEFDQVLKINPNDSNTQKIVAGLDSESKTYVSKVPAAVDHLAKAEKLFQAKNYKEAVAEYQAAADADAKFAKPYVYMGDAYLGLGDVDKSIACYKRAITIDPTDSQPLRFLGDVYEKLFDRSGEVRYLDLAIDAYGRALKIDSIAKDDLKRAQEKRAKLGTKPSTSTNPHPNTAG